MVFPRTPTKRWLAGLALVAALAGCSAVGERTTTPAAYVSQASPDQVLPAAFVGRAVPDDSTARAQSETLRTQYSVVDSGTPTQSLTLAAALSLAGVENPRIAQADEATRAGQAQLLQARVLLLPTLTGGVNYHWHNGTLQGSGGIIRNVESQDLYYGAGAAAIGAGPVAIPGVRVWAHLGDAAFEPRAAQQRLFGLLFAAQATRNSTLLQVAEYYLELVAAEERLKAIRQSEQEFAEVGRLTANFAKAGQGRQSDAERAQAETHLLHDDAERATGDLAIASANLAELLNQDPAVRLTVENGLVPLELVSADADLNSLLATAQSNRPEVGASVAAVAEARTRLRQERVRPLLPELSIGFSAGNFGGGGSLAASRFDHFDSRIDFDAIAVWSLHNAGVANVAASRQRRAELGAALFEQQRVLDHISREVSEALALIKARRAQIDTAQRQLATAERAYKLDLERARQLEGRPIELLDSARLLADARRDRIQAIVGFNQAQFRLFVALGNTP